MKPIKNILCFDHLSFDMIMEDIGESEVPVGVTDFDEF